jgi:hypothetical protein
MNKALFALILAAVSATAFAKLPPLNDEAKAKADEAKAKTAHTAKAEAYLLCKSQDKVVAHVQKTNKAQLQLWPLHQPHRQRSNPYSLAVHWAAPKGGGPFCCSLVSLCLSHLLLLPCCLTSPKPKPN